MWPYSRTKDSSAWMLILKKLVSGMLHENNYITVLLTTNSTLYSLNGIKCNMYFLIYDIHDCINWALVDVHTVDLNLTKMYIFSQDSLNMQVVKHINQLNDIPVFIILCYSIIQLYKQISYKRLVVYILTYLLIPFLI